MSHRNKDLVFTNEDLMSSDQNLHKNKRKNNQCNDVSNKRKKLDVMILSGTQNESIQGHTMIPSGTQNESIQGHTMTLSGTQSVSLQGHTMTPSGTQSVSLQGHTMIPSGTQSVSLQGHTMTQPRRSARLANKKQSNNFYNYDTDKTNLDINTDKKPIKYDGKNNDNDNDNDNETSSDNTDDSTDDNSETSSDNTDSTDDNSETNSIDIDSSEIESNDNTDDEYSNSGDDDNYKFFDKKRIKKKIYGLISSILKQKILSKGEEDLEEDLEDVLNELVDEPWFHKLSDKEQLHYINMMRKLITYEGKIPTIKDIMDMNIGMDNIKILIIERKKLDEYDKMSLSYHNACDNFLKKMEYLSNGENIKKQGYIKELERNIMNQSKFIEPLRDRILNSGFSDDTKSIIYDKYITMCNCDDEDAVKYKTWIETVLSVPHQPKKIDLDTTIPQNEAISKLIVEIMCKLNEKIYGMNEAKEEFLCIIANMIANPKSKNKAIGLYGPPGIGKTMIAKILSEVLKIPMEQISLGGVTDSSFLEGHNFTYVGSEPGCIVKAAIRMKYTNGIIFLDELDKISKSDKGKEIEHSLLHITDFTQNHNFRDKYMPEIPIDLSDFIFIYSMNTIEELDYALASRIPIIKFDGYNPKQKKDILMKYILPEILKNYGITMNELIFLEDTAEYLINNVKETDEINGKSGVRNLKNTLNRIINRINLYRLASINGKLNIKLSFDLPDFKIPYTVNTDVIKKIIAKSTDNDKSIYHNMYI